MYSDSQFSAGPKLEAVSEHQTRLAATEAY